MLSFKKSSYPCKRKLELHSIAWVHANGYASGRASGHASCDASGRASGVRVIYEWCVSDTMRMCEYFCEWCASGCASGVRVVLRVVFDNYKK